VVITEELMSDAADTKVVFISEEKAEAVFTALGKMVVQLDKDPTVQGPSYVHGKLKECRDHSNAVEQYLIEYYDVERRIKNSLNARKTEYDTRKVELLAVDPDVAKKRSAFDREALVNYRLKDVLEAIADLKTQLNDCAYVVKAVEARRDGLNRTNNDIKKQVALMEFAKGNANPLGGDYEDDGGFLSFDGPDASTPKPEDDEDIAALIDDMKIEMKKAESAPEVIPPDAAAHLDPNPSNPREDTADEDVSDLDGFLDSITTVDEAGESVQTSSDDSEDDDLAALFNTPPLDEKEADKKGPAKDDDDVVDIGKFLSQQQ
jgi:hypothetical protein